MAFCKYCGRQLADGEICNCQQANQPVQPQQPIFDPAAQQIQNPVYQNQGPSASAQAIDALSGVAQKVGFSFDPKNFGSFFSAYFKNPNAAVDAGAQAKDGFSVAMCALAFLVANIFYSLMFGIKAEMAGKGFLFGLIFGIIGIAVPFLLDRLYQITGEPKGDRGETLSKVVLHTPIASVLLIITGISVFISPKLFLILSLFTAIAYYQGMLTVLAQCAATQESSFIKKIITYVIVLIYIGVIALTFYIEFKEIFDYVSSALSFLGAMS